MVDTANTPPSKPRTALNGSLTGEGVNDIPIKTTEKQIPMIDARKTSGFTFLSMFFCLKRTASLKSLLLLISL